MPDLGIPANHFNLPDAVTGETVSLASAAGSKALLIMFICNHCPFVKHIMDELAAIGRDYTNQGLRVIAINSNDIENYPDDAPDKMALTAQARGFTFPYLMDETQDIAKAYRAACTPDFFLYDESRLLVYRGQLDASRPGNEIPVTGKDLRAAIEACLNDAPIPSTQVPSIGCNIKWKPGNAPA